MDFVVLLNVYFYNKVLLGLILLCRIGLKTYQKWEQGDASPSQSAWTIYTFELRAQKIGFQSLDNLMDFLEQKHST